MMGSGKKTNESGSKERSPWVGKKACNSKSAIARGLVAMRNIEVVVHGANPSMPVCGAGPSSLCFMLNCVD
jgi:hypothetical protein